MGRGRSCWLGGIEPVGWESLVAGSGQLINTRFGDLVLCCDLCVLGTGLQLLSHRPPNGGWICPCVPERKGIPHHLIANLLSPHSLLSVVLMLLGQEVCHRALLV